MGQNLDWFMVHLIWQIQSCFLKYMLDLWMCSMLCSFPFPALWGQMSIYDYSYGELNFYSFSPPSFMFMTMDTHTNICINHLIILWIIGQLAVRKCYECGQPLPESFQPLADEPWTTGIFGCAEDRESCKFIYNLLLILFLAVTLESGLVLVDKCSYFQMVLLFMIWLNLYETNATFVEANFLQLFSFYQTSSINFIKPYR